MQQFFLKKRVKYHTEGYRRILQSILASKNEFQLRPDYIDSTQLHIDKPMT